MVKYILVFLAVIYADSAYAGKASYYGKQHHGKRTANGERFNMNAMTCAHRSARFGTLITVRYRGRSVVCRVNDRGPFVRGRVLDLSYGAAKQIGLVAAGVGSVSLSF